MNKHPLDAIFNPKSVVVIGASDKPGSVGGAVLTNLCRAGFSGRLSVVNSKGGTVNEYPAFGSIDELSDAPDLAIICTPAKTVAGLLRDCARRGVGGMIVISSGFREAGSEGKVLEAELTSASQQFPHVRFIGPNCLGVIKPSIGLNASFSPVMPSPGRITLLSQSGALCTGILDWAISQGIGIATCVSVGNTTNVGMADLIDYFADDPATDALLLYIEGLNDASRFIAAARRCAVRKPIIAYKAGRFAESSKAAASHTGAIASADNIYQAAFRRAGIERANSIQELFDCATLLGGDRRHIGPRLAIITNAGGPGVMACDAWIELGRHLAKLSDDTLVRLDQSLPAFWSHGNPIDVLGDATVERFQLAITHTLADPNVDALLVVVTPQTMTRPDQIAEAIVSAHRKTTKQIVASFIGGEAVRGARERLRDSGIPTYDFPEEAVGALNHLLSVNQMRIAHSEEAPVKASASRLQERETSSLSQERFQRWRSELSSKSGLVDEARSKKLLEEYGIPTAMTRIARSMEEAVSNAEEIGFPVALKIVSPEISHKTDVGGVALNITDATSVRSHYEQLLIRVRRNCPNARIDGVAVEPMISGAGGIELLLGMTRDPQFGPALLIGAGGVTAELQRDTALELGPFDHRVVDEMLRSLRLYPLLQGYRGRPGVNIAELQEVVMRFGKLANDFPELSVVEINPLLVSPNQVIALDARMISSGPNS